VRCRSGTYYCDGDNVAKCDDGCSGGSSNYHCTATEVVTVSRDCRAEGAEVGVAKTCRYVRNNSEKGSPTCFDRNLVACVSTPALPQLACSSDGKILSCTSLADGAAWLNTSLCGPGRTCRTTERGYTCADSPLVSCSLADYPKCVAGPTDAGTILRCIHTETAGDVLVTRKCGLPCSIEDGGSSEPRTTCD
jgi:hypothetical protein